MKRLAVAMLCAAAALWSQATGEVSGAVTDASGAAVAGAGLTLANEATAVSLRGETNESGVYRFTGLIPGGYRLEIRRQGFSPVVVRGIAVEANRIARADAALQVASTEQTVEVSASAQMLDVESGTKGYTLNLTQARDLPLQSRNPLALMTLTPGVVAPAAATGASATTRQASDGTAASSGYSINGGARTGLGGFQEYVVDGISVTNQRDGGVLALPAADSLQEFRVQSGGMSPEHGRTVGGVVTYVTVSGANEFHGNLFASNRNTATTARRALPAVGRKPINNFNQFGGTFSGPVTLPGLYRGQGRTFFFFGYEGSRWLRNNPTNDTVPTVRMRQGDFGEVAARIYDPASAANAAQRTPFADNRIPAARFNRFGKTVLDAFPTPSSGGVAGNYIGAFRVLTPVDNYTGRADHAFNDRHRVFARVTWVDSINNMGWNLGSIDGRTGISNLPSRGLTANYNFTARPNLLYSAAFGMIQFHRTFVDPTGNEAGAGFFGFAVNPAPAAAISNIRPAMNFDIYRSIGNITTEDQRARSWQVNQSLAWVRGRQTLRFGSDVRLYRAGGLLTVGAPNGSFTFNPLQTSQGTATTGHTAASTLLGMANAGLISQPPVMAMSKTVPAWFVQDDIRVTRRLTVNLGVRIDYEGGLSEAANQVGWFDPDAAHSTVRRPGVFRYADGAITKGVWQYSPRVGFAWSPGSKGRTAVRGAFGAYGSPLPTDGYFAAAPGYEALIDFVKPSAADPAAVLQARYDLPAAAGPIGETAYLGQGVAQPFGRLLRTPRIYQWNFGVQHELARNLMIDVLYTGNRGTRLLNARNVNLAPEALIQQAIGLTGSTGSATAAQTFLNERVANPLSGLVPGVLGAATVTRVQAGARFPHFANVSPALNERDAIYHALQATAQRRLSRDLTFLVAYTWSKTINNYQNQQNPYNLRDARGAAGIDRPHIFSTNAVWRLPFGKGHALASSGWRSALLGGFQLTGILQMYSGSPVSVTQSAANGLGVGTARPDAIGDPAGRAAAVRGSVAANGNVIWFDRASYQIVNGRFGSAPASDARLRTPGYAQTDFGLSRDFRVVERLVLRARADAFNAFNRTNLVSLDSNASSPTFAQVSAVADPRIFQFGLELRF